MNRRGHRGRVDGNQRAIVAALRGIGAHVQSLASVGDGCPDLLVVYRGRVHALEVKRPGEPLTPDEIAWHTRAKARGHEVPVVETGQQAIDVLTSDAANERI